MTCTCTKRETANNMRWVQVKPNAITQSSLLIVLLISIGIDEENIR